MIDRRNLSRRTFLADTGMGFTGLALSALLWRDGVGRADTPPAPPSQGGETLPPDGRPHFRPKAKSVIWLFMCGGVSHVESFDIKPELNRYAGTMIENTPYRHVLSAEGRDVIAGNPVHGNRHTL